MTDADRLLAAAEAALQQRRCGEALGLFTDAEGAGAGADRCDAGRWMAYMLLGAYEQAWAASDAIRARGGEDALRFWQGEPLEGRRVMLRCLHGYGDTVMYLRWLPLLRAVAREVTVQAAPEMLPLLRCMPETGRVVTWTAPGESDAAEWDVQVECAELPYLFRATPATLPGPVRLVFPEFAAHRVRERMGQRRRPRVGLVWRGSDYDAARSIPFPLLRDTLLGRHDVEWWSLQPPASNGEWLLKCIERGWGGRNFYEVSGAGVPVDDGIANMAACAAELDLVITIDTLAAHVAGSLGVETWLLLKQDADWRWMAEGDGTPWYPGMRLVRQRAAGGWAEVLERVNEDLRDWVPAQQEAMA